MADALLICSSEYARGIAGALKTALDSGDELPGKPVVVIDASKRSVHADARHYAAAGVPIVLYGAGPRTIEEAMPTRPTSACPCRTSPRPRRPWP